MQSQFLRSDPRDVLNWYAQWKWSLNRSINGMNIVIESGICFSSEYTTISICSFFFFVKKIWCFYKFQVKLLWFFPSNSILDYCTVHHKQSIKQILSINDSKCFTLHVNINLSLSLSGRDSEIKKGKFLHFKFINWKVKVVSCS